MSHPDRKSILPRGRLYEPTLQAETAAALRALLREDMQARAWVKDDEDYPFHPDEPFVVYEPMDTKQESGLGVLLGRLVGTELGLEKEELLLVGVPRSATWIAKVIAKEGTFANARVAAVTKDPRREPFGAAVREVPVLSYTHKRQPDGSRGKEAISFFEPDRFRGSHVLMLDDVVAEGETVLGMARALRDMGAARIDVAVVLSKLMQGGSEKILRSELVGNYVEGVRISAVRGPGFGKLVFE